MKVSTRYYSLELPNEEGMTIPEETPSFETIPYSALFLGLCLTQPRLARERLAVYPVSLDLARRKARAAGLKNGAIFCKMTPDGQPCEPDNPPALPLNLSPTFELARSIIDYYRTTLDFNFLLSGGADLVFEAARLFVNIQKLGLPFLPDPSGALLNQIWLSLTFADRLWTMLANAGRQQVIAARLALTEQEIRDCRTLAASLEKQTDKRTFWPPFPWQGLFLPAFNPPEAVTAVADREARLTAVLAVEAAGLVVETEELSFTPSLPAGWLGYSLRLTWRGSRFELSVSDQGAQMILTEGSAIAVVLNGQEALLEDELRFAVLHL
jgi:hypothetical protein